MGQAKRLNAMLLIEGRTIPFVGANCHFRSNQPAAATIEMVPLREINDILPRTMVHLFVKDFNYPGKFKPWVLAFEGEVYGYSLGKNPQNRTFSLLCMDLSNYWDSAKQSYINVKTSMSSPNAMLSSVKTKESAKRENMKFIENVGSITAYVVKIINDRLAKDGDEAFLQGVLDIIKGVQEVNPFFKYSDLRYRISDRIGFESSGDLKKIFKATNKQQFFESLLGKGGGGITTVRQLINLLMGLVFHQFSSVPFPSKINAPKGAKGNWIGEKKNKTIGSFLFKPDSFMLPPPRCNVLYPDQYNNFGYTRNFFHEVSRLDFRPGPLASDIAGGSGVPRIYQKGYHAPAAYSEFLGSDKDTSDVKGKSFENAGVSGTFGDKIEDLKTASTLKEFNFMSYEEVLKGIFGDQGNMMTSAQLLSKDSGIGEQGVFFQKAADFMFSKKRYASRVTSTSGPLNLSPVPGFPMLIIDNSEAEQHVVGQLEGISHSFTANGGGFTSYEISYGRLVEEKSLWDDSISEPPIPPWYDPKKYGTRRPVQEQDYKNLDKSVQSRVKNLGEINDFGNSDIGSIYATLLGESKEGSTSYLGSTPITSKKFPNITAATFDIVRRYKWAKRKGVVPEHINKYTKRNYAVLHDVFEFLGAELTQSQKWATHNNADNIVFKGKRFDGGFVNEAEEENSQDKKLKNLFGETALSKRRAPIIRYRKKLFNERGFRG